MNKTTFKYLPPQKRKKILLICDDIRVHSGVATVAKEIVIHTKNLKLFRLHETNNGMLSFLPNSVILVSISSKSNSGSAL